MRLLLCFLICCVLSQNESLAQTKYSAVLDAYETTEKPASAEPARLVNQVLRDEFNKGSLVHIVERKNAAPGAKLQPAQYYVGAKIDGLSFIGTKPVRIALIMDLTKFSSRELMFISEKTRHVEPQVIESSVKLTGAAFDNSEYGKALAELSREAAQAFEAKAANLKE